jgi:hypothetical protein
MSKLPDWYFEMPYHEIEQKAEEHGVDPLLLAAICQHESGGIHWRTRFEPGCREKYLQSHREHADWLGISHETERVAQMHSYGIAQVMGWLARSQGFRGYLVQLAADPALCLDHACIYLKSLMRRYPEESDWISAYNWGHVKKTPGGFYMNQKWYVDKVHYWLEQLRGAR